MTNALINATAYALDERCNTNAAGTMSTKLSIGHSVIITTYEVPDCVTAVNATEVTQSAVVYQQCVDGANRFYLGGPGFQYDRCRGLRGPFVLRDAGGDQIYTGLRVRSQSGLR